MQNTERQKFEDSWKSAFDGAETTPSDSVWNSIELELAGQESAAMKKRVVFYQRLAAATVIFALLTGTYAFYTNYNNKGEEIKQTVTNKVVEKEPVKSNEGAADPQVAIAEKEQVVAPAKKEVKETHAVSIAATTQAATDIESPPTGNLIIEDTPKEVVKESVASPIIQTAPLTASLEEQKAPEEVIPKRERSRATWLALGAAAGNFTPNAGNPQVEAASFDSQFSSAAPGPESADARANRSKIGSSYTVGMAVGKKFGRFVVQSGVNLGKQTIDYTSTIDTRTTSNISKASTSFYSAAGNTFATTPYTVNSSMDVVSIPVQAGYVIVDRRLAWQVNAGVSPDFFLRNTLVDKSGQRQKFTQSAGDESPYRSVNWSGLMNTELSYRVGDHYRISLVPGMRYSFTSILKDDPNWKPLILDVGFRFRYMFN